MIDHDVALNVQRSILSVTLLMHNKDPNGQFGK